MRIATTTAAAVLVALLLSAGLFVGCDEKETVSFYRAPKDPPQTASPAEASVMPIADTQDAGGKTKLHWDTPEEWKELPASQFRVAAFRASDDGPVDVTVIPLGPESGALLPNVNRWEKELGIDASPEDKLGELTKTTKVADLDVTLVDLKGKEKSTLAAIVPHAGKVWFFKMMGPGEGVEKQRENFLTFINSLHAAEEGHKHGDEAHGDPHAGHDHAKDPHAAADPHGAAVSKLAKHATPEGWREVPDSKPPRMLALEVGEGEKKAEMVATRFAAGNAGSFADNINRWHKQLGLPPVDDPRKLPMKDAVVGKDGEGVALEMANAATKQSMVVVIASARGDLWFFKFTGPTETITAERPKFDAFLKSLEFGGEMK